MRKRQKRVGREMITKDEEKKKRRQELKEHFVATQDGQGQHFYVFSLRRLIASTSVVVLVFFYFG
jgi:hypothetical protein